jgi:hypothetical protein
VPSRKSQLSLAGTATLHPVFRSSQVLKGLYCSKNMFNCILMCCLGLVRCYAPNKGIPGLRHPPPGPQHRARFPGTSAAARLVSK